MSDAWGIWCNHMEVSYGSSWSFCRWANGAFDTPDFDAPVGVVDFNGSPVMLTNWTGQYNIGQNPCSFSRVEAKCQTPGVFGAITAPDPEPEPPTTETPTPEPPHSDIEYHRQIGEVYERISVEFMGLKHLEDNYIEELEK